MQRVTRSSAAPTMPPPPASPGPPGFFTSGNPGAGIPATIPGQEWFNGVQEELVGLVLRSGLAPSSTDMSQVRASLDRLYGGAVVSITANVTLTPAEAGLLLVDAAAGSRTLTLPAANAAAGRPLPFRIVRLDGSANTVTVQRAGADVFLGGAASVTIPRNGALSLQSDGVAIWHTITEHARGRSIGTNGWAALPGGLIVQWGGGMTTTGDRNTISFPTTFPTACLQVVVGEGSAVGWGSPPSATIHGVSAVTAANYAHSSIVVPNSGPLTYGANITFRYIAIGH